MTWLSLARCVSSQCHHTELYEYAICDTISEVSVQAIHVSNHQGHKGHQEDPMHSVCNII